MQGLLVEGGNMDRKKRIRSTDLFRAQGETLPNTRTDEQSSSSSRHGPQRTLSGRRLNSSAAPRHRQCHPGRPGVRKGNERPWRRNGNNAKPALMEGLHSPAPQPLGPLPRFGTG